MNKPEKKKELITDDVKWLRGLLCNGTMDCENEPECPEGTDGCVVDEIIKWHQEPKTNKTLHRLSSDLGVGLPEAMILADYGRKQARLDLPSADEIEKISKVVRASVGIMSDWANDIDMLLAKAISKRLKGKG